jgi:2-dehydropantoate 2-reductase
MTVRVVIFGAGAVGGVVGGRLAEHGHPVVLIARGEHGRALADGGLVVESPAGSRTLRVPVATDPGTVDWQADDVVMLAVKSQDTAAALRALAACVAPSTPVVCLQNGVDNERAALRYFSAVYGVCVMLPAAHLEPGVVQAYSDPVPGILDLGRYPTGEDPLAQRLATMLQSATFDSVARPDVMRWKYRKLIMNLANAVEALCGAGAAGGELAAMARAEGEQVLALAGVEVASEAEDRARRGRTLRLGEIDGRARGGGSSWQSLVRGTGSIEADYLNGEIVLLGRMHGRPTPVNATLQRLANEAARRGAEPGATSEAHVLDEVARAEAGLSR